MSLPQQAFIDRLTELLRADERIRSAWLTGSFGRGTADEFSDIDTTLIVAPEHIDELRQPAVWDAFIAPLGKPLLRRGAASQRAPYAFINHVYPDWLRWDAVLRTAAEGTLVRGLAVPLFDRDGARLLELEHVELSERERLDSAAPIIEEYWRCLGLLPVLLGRGDLVGARVGAGRHLDLLLAIVKGLDEPVETGMLHLHTTLAPAHYAALAALPPLGADRTSIVALVHACTDTLRRLLDDVAPGRDRTLEDAALAHVAASIEEWT